MLTNVKTLLGINDTLQDNQLNLILSNAKAQLLNAINEDTVPERLTYIVLEYTVYRYRLLGSEASSSESIFDSSTSYTQETLGIKYQKEIESYLNSKKVKTKATFSTYF